MIVSADGKATDRVSTLQRIIRGHKPGETVTLEVMRFGEKKSFKVKLIEAPDQSQVAAADDPESADASRPPRPRAAASTSSASPSSRCLPRSRRGRACRTLYRRGLMVSEVNVTGPARGKIFADNTMLLQVLNPAPRRELHSAADLDAVLVATAEGRRRDVPRVRRAAGPAGPRLDARGLAGSRAVERATARSEYPDSESLGSLG